MSVKGLLNWNSWGVRPEAGARPAETDVKPAATGVRPVDNTLLVDPPILLPLEVATSLMQRLAELRALALRII